MKPPVVHHDREDKEKVEIRAECRAEDGRKHVEKVKLKTHDVDTLKFVERKLINKGVQRLDRHPADGLPLKHDPKKGHGGKYSWEGPDKEFENELLAEAAIDDKDPNYVDEDEEKTDEELVIGAVETPKAAAEGVARIEVDHPHLKTN